MMTTLKRMLLPLAAIALTAAVVTAAEIGFIEDFALAPDRTVPLKQLIPGTEDYYYYYCLHYQNARAFDQVPPLLKLWIERYGRTGRVLEIENRQALLTYDKDPQATLALLRNRLGVQFNHQREILGQPPTLQTALDPKVISRATLMQRALRDNSGTIAGFEDTAVEWLIAAPLDGDRRRDLLNRLTLPDYENLVKLISEDLHYRNSGGFGSLTVHGTLLPSQLEELLKLEPGLLNESNFVNVYLSKLAPNPDQDWEHNPQVKLAYLERLWTFVSRLVPAYNSLKVNVLYQRLEFDRAQGVWDKDRFMAYIALPRSVNYISQKYMEKAENRDAQADLNFSGVPLLPPVSFDEPLVRSYLQHFFLAEDSYAPYEVYIRDSYLKDAFAETKIVNGIGDQEKWYALLSPERYQELKERIDLDFVETNRPLFGPDEAVALDLYVKNAPTLIVKVYRINTLNFYRSAGTEVSTDINLDGLVANDEKTYTYAEPALRRVRRHFEFADLKERGTYVIDFIGNGKASRALIRKGKLTYLVRTSVAGQVVTILDEKGQKVPDAALYLAGHRFDADKDGLITMPFSNAPGRQPIILARGDFACLDQLQQLLENYRLDAGIHVEREALLKRKTATMALRSMLSLNGTPVTLSVLETPSLVITSVDQEGVSTSKEVMDFKLFEDRESTYDFQVPENLARITFTLKAKVQNLSQNKKLDLTASHTFELNGIDATEKVEDLHLTHAGGQYFLDVLGKTGEAKPDRPVNFEFKHRDFRQTVHVSLQTDKKGRVLLGALADITWVKGTGPEGTAHQWRTLRDTNALPGAIHAKAGDTISVPYSGSFKEVVRAAFSLLEVTRGQFTRDAFTALKLEDGFLRIQALPAGDYSLVLKESGTTIQLRLTAGEARDGFVISPVRRLEVPNPAPLQITAVTADKDNVRIQLKNATPFARVHVAATAFMPEYPLAADLYLAQPGPLSFMPGVAESAYVVGRDIGDEYRYIIDRKYAKKFAGNLLPRPGLLLNPWSVRKTATASEVLKLGGMFGGRNMDALAKQGQQFGGAGLKGGGAANFADLDFLAQAAVVKWNLQADAQGVVTLSRAALGAHHQLHVLAVDPQNLAYREVSLPEVPVPFIDLRLANGLDVAKHFTEQKQITVVQPGTPFVVADITTSKFEAYDSLAKVYTLYSTLSGDATLAEFSFILRWPKMKPEEKQQLYSKYACHELSFFLYRKDPAFFEKVVQPYLRNKKDKTFLDHWLIGDDLTGYLQPWRHAQLNTFEQILLAQRVQGEAPTTARFTKERQDLIPPNIEAFNQLFKTALKGSSLETADSLGLASAVEKAQAAKPVLLGALRKASSTREEAKSLKEAESGEALADMDGSDAAAAPAEAAAAFALAAAPPAAPGAAAPAADEQMDRKSDMPHAKLEMALESRSKSKDAAAAGEFKKVAADGKYFDQDRARRANVRQLYRKLDKTEEWAENNYYHLLIGAQNAQLITVNAFWRDYAAWGGKTPFFSTNLAEASRSFAEMMLALAVLDLPYEAGKHAPEYKDATLTLKAGSPLVVYHKEIKPAPEAAQKTPILVSQNYFRQSDRYTYVDNEKVDKYVADEFLTAVVYGCQVVVTNPTSSRQKLDVLLQIPRGTIPVRNGQYTRGVHIDLEPYRTQTFEYFFYFPQAGAFPHYPVHVARNEALIAFCPATTLTAVDKPTKIDRTSWDYISQNGTPEEVVRFLNDNNLLRINLERIAWRMRDAAFFNTAIPLLAQRHLYNHVLWSYALQHNAAPALREYLRYSDGFVAQCGAALDSPLLTINPVERKSYQHLEYSPLVNARAHKVGKQRVILNDTLAQQYQRLLRILACHAQLDADDLMAVTYYLLLQDRVEEALAAFQKVDPKKLATALQYDYFQACLDFYGDKHDLAGGIAKKYLAYPVDRWRNLFAAVDAQLAEVESKDAAVIDKENREQQQAKLAATEPGFDFKVEARQITVNYQNLTECRVNYYLMDIELLFSRNPFVQQYTDQFSFIRPNQTDVVKLPAKKTTLTFDLPKQFSSSNVMVEIEAGAVRKSQAYFASQLALQVIENYGQLKVTVEKSGAPLAKAYVKVYARMQGGEVKFYKDGYTDLRGRFDYASLSTDEADRVERFSVLVLSETDGAVVREAAAPKQ